jgi:hypothetical protein
MGPGVVPPFIPPQPEAGMPPMNNPMPYYPPGPGNGPVAGWPGIPPLVPPAPSPGVDWYPYPGYEGYPETAHNFVGYPFDAYRGPRIVPVTLPRRTRRGTTIYAKRFDPIRIHKEHAQGAESIHRFYSPE